MGPYFDCSSPGNCAIYRPNIELDGFSGNLNVLGLIVTSSINITTQTENTNFLGIGNTLSGMPNEYPYFQIDPCYSNCGTILCIDTKYENSTGNYFNQNDVGTYDVEFIRSSLELFRSINYDDYLVTLNSSITYIKLFNIGIYNAQSYGILIDPSPEIYTTSSSETNPTATTNPTTIGPSSSGSGPSSSSPSGTKPSTSSPSGSSPYSGTEQTESKSVGFRFIVAFFVLLLPLF